MHAVPPERDGRARVAYLVAAAIIMACGLVWRLAPLGLSAFLLKYGGSVLWSAMVYCLCGAVLPRSASRIMIAATALFFATAVELFRLVQTPTLDAFRLTLVGALLLGRVFSLWNIAAYAVGIGAVYGADLLRVYRGRIRSRR